MVDYMSVEEQVDADFCRARRRAFLRQVMARLRKDGDSDGLLAFDDLRKVPGAMRRRHPNDGQSREVKLEKPNSITSRNQQYEYTTSTRSTS